VAGGRRPGGPGQPPPGGRGVGVAAPRRLAWVVRETRHSAGRGLEARRPDGAPTAPRRRPDGAPTAGNYGRNGAEINRNPQKCWSAVQLA